MGGYCRNGSSRNRLEGTEWIGGVKWRAFVNAAMNPQFSQNARNSLTTGEASQEGLCSME